MKPTATLLLTLATILHASTFADTVAVEVLPGGSATATGGPFELNGTLAQPLAGFTSASGVVVFSGFAAWDQFPPVIVCQATEVQLDGGFGPADPAAITLGSTDNRAIASIEVEPDFFSDMDIGTVIVEVTIRDHAGHSATGTTTVTVLGEATAVNDWHLLEP